MLSALISNSIRLRVVVLAACVVLLVVGARSVRRAPLDVFPEFAPPLVEIPTRRAPPDPPPRAPITRDPSPPTPPPPPPRRDPPVNPNRPSDPLVAPSASAVVPNAAGSSAGSVLDPMSTSGAQFDR